MIDDAVREIADAGGGNAAKLALQRVADVLTPIEYRTLGERLDTTLRETVYAPSEITRLAGLGSPQAYRRLWLARGALLYTDPDVPQRQKFLAVCFAGRAQRMMIPNVAFLQCLDAARYDVLILRDPATNHFRGGCPGYAGSFLEIVRAVERDLPARRYEAVVSFGASMGGLPAAWYGLMAGTHRAVCVSGRPAWDITRLADHQGPTHHYDPLCACEHRHHPNIVFVHGAEHEADRENARAYAALVGGRRIGVPRIRSHSFLHVLWGEGVLGGFLERVFRSDRSFGFRWVPRDAVGMPTPSGPST